MRKSIKAAIAAKKEAKIEQNRIKREEKRVGRAPEQEAKQASEAAKVLKRANIGFDSGRGKKIRTKKKRALLLPVSGLLFMLSFRGAT
jgi:hypothetical protein